MTRTGDGLSENVACTRRIVPRATTPHARDAHPRVAASAMLRRDARRVPRALAPPGVRARLRAASPRSPRPATTAAADATSTPASSAAAEVDPAEVYEIQSGKDDGESIASTRAWLEARAADPACAGVYALYDRDERMQFVGYRRDVRAAVAAHAEVNGADAAKVRVAAFANRATATRANLRAEADRWIREWVDARGGEETEIPRGNLAVGAAEWTLAPEPWEEEAAVVPGAMNAGGAHPHPRPRPRRTRTAMS